MITRKVRALLPLMCFTAGASAQDLVIDNARILDGTGRVIERGAVVIEDGRIASVSTAPLGRPGALDATGLTVLPGYVDAHRHIMNGDPDIWMRDQAADRMREYLEAGFTTVFSAIDPTEQIVRLREMLESGELTGPRIRVGGFVPLAITPPIAPPGEDPARYDNSRPPMRPTEAAQAIPEDQTRAAVRRLAEAGVDAIKTVITVTPGGPEQQTLSVIVEEAERHGLMSVTHAVSVQDTLAAVATGTHILVHTPHIGQLDDASTRTIVEAGIPMVSTLGVFVPAFNENNEPLFRDRGPFPMNTLSSAGQGPVNARLLWEAGIVYGYGTDTSWLPVDALAHELRPLSLVFSSRDIVRILTVNAAESMGLGDQVGTLEPGKLGDMVLVDGDPLSDVFDLTHATVVVKEGRIVVDAR